MKIIIILVIILCSCKSTPVVYFKHPDIKIHESDSHLHGKLHSPHFIPINHEQISTDLVNKYDLLYGNTHVNTNKTSKHSTLGWMVIYLLIGLITII
jgi:hypothetical protein